MTQQQVSDESPGGVLFPEYAALYDLIADEVRGLSDEELDWESDRWEWSRWSIRRQVSHMSSLIYRWLLLRWGDVLYPEGGHGVADVQGIANSEFDRRMDEVRYWELGVILESLRGGIDLAQRVMEERSVGFLRSHTITRTDQTGQAGQQSLMARAHPSGATPTDEPGTSLLTLEWTMRHIYFEETTHLYNIQRLKRAQGLDAVVDVPEVGYWVLNGWDRSEA